MKMLPDNRPPNRSPASSSIAKIQNPSYSDDKRMRAENEEDDEEKRPLVWR